MNKERVIRWIAGFINIFSIIALSAIVTRTGEGWIAVALIIVISSSSYAKGLLDER